MLREIAAAVLISGLFLSGAGSGEAGKTVGSGPNLGRVLIVYYSFTGATRRLAEALRSLTGGDLLEIVPAESYSRDTVLDTAKKQIQDGQVSELTSPIPDVAGYDLLLIGSPVWWGSPPPPLLGFLRRFDFQGKPAALFCTYGGGLGGYFEKVEAAARNASVIARLDLTGAAKLSDPELTGRALTWLASVAASGKRQ